MKSITIALVSGLSTLALSAFAESSTAQVVPDGTVGSIVSPTNVITGGTRSGNNLFHSFRQFSIPTNGSAIFNNATNVQNIFSRVTGTSQSSIDGLIRSQGNANLFLMNPNGIIFGPNAKLAIGGSFLGTTANSIKFADGVQFDAGNTIANPLLTVSLPIGLQMGQSSGSIQVNGPAHTLTISDTLGLTPLQQPTRPGLQLRPGKSLALIGGDINLNNGVLGAAQGTVAIGSVSQGFINLDTTTPTWTLGYTNSSTFSDVKLTGRSLLDVSGVNAGKIQVQGRQISLKDGSVLLSQNVGSQAGGVIQLNASQQIQISGTSSNGKIRSGIYSETLATGAGSKVAIAAPIIQVTQGGNVFTKSFNRGVGGDVQITSGSLKVEGVSTLNPSQTSSIGSGAFNVANSGNVTVTTQDLQILDGASLATLTFGTGTSGKVLVTADTIMLDRISPMGSPSVVATTSFGNGNSGQLVINTRTLKIFDGGGIAGTGYAKGNAGSIVVNASESIEIKGFTDYLGDRNHSSINSSVLVISPSFQKLLNLTNSPSGAAGSIEIRTPNVNLDNDALIIARNTGSGQGGNLMITADKIQLNQESRLSSQTVSGSGGNIVLNTELLMLRRSSSITAESGGQGNGGNIKISSPLIIGLENSDIVANAVKGRGGNIKIATEGLFGLKYRDRLTPENDITASSEFGINGTVQINSFGLDPSSGLVKLDGNIIDSSRSISKGCSANQGNSFVSTGRGGIPQDPANKRIVDRSWHDLRTPIASQSTLVNLSKIQNPKSKIVEASQIQINADGSIALVDSQQPIINSGITCAIGS